MEYTAYSLLVDVGAICVLLLVGALVRATLKPVQRLLLPASITAGVLGLALGPHGLSVIPFSDALGDYTAILIAVLFASLAFSGSFDMSRIARGAKGMWSYAMAMYTLQWGLGLAFTLVVLTRFFDLPDGFGLMLAVGWSGGFGTAAAVGDTFAQSGWEEATSLGFTSATVGVVVCIMGGIALAKWAALRGHTTTIRSFDALPPAIRTGLLSEKDRPPIGRATVSPGSVDPVALHIGLVGAAVLGGYGVVLVAEAISSDVTVPLFAASFLVGLLIRVVVGRTPARSYVDAGTMHSLSGSSTDLLVAFGIASITPDVVVTYAVPLTLLLFFGLVYCLLMLRYLTPRVFETHWFEKGLFTWGWSTAAVPNGIALLRIVDPDSESGTLEEYAVAYVPFAPFEIGMVVVAPLVVAAGLSWAFLGGSIAIGVGALALGAALGWLGGASALGRRTPQSDRTR